MKKVYYRHEHGTTHNLMKHFAKHIKRLGKITKIEAYRFRSKRSYKSEENNERRFYSTTHERLRVRGENGVCVFDAVCWGYGGSGPHATFAILKECGVDETLAKFMAFSGPRCSAQLPGIDWEIDVENMTYKTRFKSRGKAVA